MFQRGVRFWPCVCAAVGAEADVLLRTAEAMSSGFGHDGLVDGRASADENSEHRRDLLIGASRTDAQDAAEDSACQTQQYRKRGATVSKCKLKKTSGIATKYTE